MPPLQSFIENLPGPVVLHDQIGVAIFGLTEVEHSYDIGVIELGYRLGFYLEASQLFWSGAGMEKLDRNFDIQVAVVAEAHFAGSASTEQLQIFVSSFEVHRFFLLLIPLIPAEILPYSLWTFQIRRSPG